MFQKIFLSGKVITNLRIHICKKISILQQKCYFIYFINPFTTYTNILIFIFTYNLLK